MFNRFLKFVNNDKSLFVILPFSLSVVSFSSYSLYSNFFNDKKFDDDITERYTIFRDNNNI